MSETQSDKAVQKVLDVRKVGADYEEHRIASPLDIPVDLHNFMVTARLMGVDTYADSFQRW